MMVVESMSRYQLAIICKCLISPLDKQIISARAIVNADPLSLYPQNLLAQDRNAKYFLNITAPDPL